MKRSYVVRDLLDLHDGRTVVVLTDPFALVLEQGVVEDEDETLADLVERLDGFTCEPCADYNFEVFIGVHALFEGRQALLEQYLKLGATGRTQLGERIDRIEDDNQ